MPGNRKFPNSPHAFGARLSGPFERAHTNDIISQWFLSAQKRPTPSNSWRRRWKQVGFCLFSKVVLVACYSTAPMKIPIEAEYLAPSL
jgi:hypothetical protein